MAKKIWLHIAPVIKPEDDATKALLTASLKEKLAAATSAAIVPHLPSNISTKEADRPKKVAKKWNALKITATNTVQIESKGNSAFVMCKVRILMEVIKTPDLVRTQFVGGGSKGAGVSGVGSDEAAFVKIAKQTFGHFMKELMEAVIKASRIRAKQVGLVF
jgi:hypothetical protein